MSIESGSVDSKKAKPSNHQSSLVIADRKSRGEPRMYRLRRVSIATQNPEVKDE